MHESGYASASEHSNRLMKEMAAALVVLSAYYGPMLLFDLSYWTDGMYGQLGKGMIDDLLKYKIKNSIRFQLPRNPKDPTGGMGSPSPDPPEIDVVIRLKPAELSWMLHAVMFFVTP